MSSDMHFVILIIAIMVKKVCTQSLEWIMRMEKKEKFKIETVSKKMTKMSEILKEKKFKTIKHVH